MFLKKIAGWKKLTYQEGSGDTYTIMFEFFTHIHLSFSQVPKGICFFDGKKNENFFYGMVLVEKVIITLSLGIDHTT